MTENDIVALEADAIRAVRQAFDAIEAFARGKMSREEAQELFDQCLTAHDLAYTARGTRPSGRRHGWSGASHPH
jgi:hypothetical protein